jgi:hypothetical protein
MLVFAFGLVLDGNCYIMSFPRILGFLVIIPLRHRVHSPRYLKPDIFEFQPVPNFVEISGLD